MSIITTRKRKQEDRMPKTMELLVNCWKSREYSKKEIEDHYDAHWGDDDIKCIKCGGRKMIDIISDKLEDVDDNFCRIYFNMETFEFKGPFRYLEEDEDKEADKLAVKDEYLLVFAK